MTETNEAQTNEASRNDFLVSTCCHCGAELAGNVQSPDDGLCCDCYKYSYRRRNDNDDDYVETESEV